MINLSTNSGSMVDEAVDDLVILLDDQGTPVGTSARLAVHTSTTPLHRAFSCYLFDDRGRVLITRRALTKVTWPGVWTNACCGHPRPEEDDRDAIRRRAFEELGIEIQDPRPVLPDFRYRAVDAGGIVENEICPVYVARTDGGELNPDPDEVMDWAWVEWEALGAAVTATPQVFSPWSVLQVEQLADRLRGLTPTSAQCCPVDLTGFLAAVEDELVEQLGGLDARWHPDAQPVGLDVLPDDLPAMLSAHLIGKGKRFRATMVWWGFLAGGGSAANGQQMAQAVRAAAALELLHLFGLIHDDVMDESQIRRGLPAAHIAASRHHEDAGVLGSSSVFGNNIAILLGDLAHMLADQIMAEAPRPMRDVWYQLCTELMVGQRADLTGAAAGRRDRDHATHVARLKSGRYTIDRPLQLGAMAADANDTVLDVLARYADHAGAAFALRDDLLGVWGDPEVTGKPASDDLVEGKATMVLSLASDVLEGSEADLLGRVGSERFGQREASHLAKALERAGVRNRMEELISAEHDRAVAFLGPPLEETCIAGLTVAAGQIAWRNR